jgi:intraflagellar transport protein 81
VQLRDEKQQSGPRLLKAEEFKAYVAKLRTKSLHYKAKKTELTELRSEFAILSKTEEILRTRDSAALQALVRCVVVVVPSM